MKGSATVVPFPCTRRERVQLWDIRVACFAVGWYKKRSSRYGLMRNVVL